MREAVKKSTSTLDNILTPEQKREAARKPHERSPRSAPGTVANPAPGGGETPVVVRLKEGSGGGKTPVVIRLKEGSGGEQTPVAARAAERVRLLGKTAAQWYIDSIDKIVHLTDAQKKAITATIEARGKASQEFQAKNAEKLKAASATMVEAYKTKDNDFIAKVKKAFMDLNAPMYEGMKKSQSAVGQRPHARPEGEIERKPHDGLDQGPDRPGRSHRRADEEAQGRLCRAGQDERPRGHGTQVARGGPQRPHGRAESGHRQAPGDGLRQVDVRPGQVDRRAGEERRGHDRGHDQ